MKKLCAVAGVLAMTAFVAGCGGSGGSGGGGGGGGGIEPVAQVPGTVTQAPVAGATVIADLNGNLVADPGEVTAVTGPDGKFVLNLPAGYGQYTLVSVGGTDANGLPAGLMIAGQPVDLQVPTMVTPVSTMFALAPPELIPTLQASLGGVGPEVDISQQSIPVQTIAVIKGMEAASAVFKLTVEKMAAAKPAITPEMQAKLLADLQTQMVKNIAANLSDPSPSESRDLSDPDKVARMIAEEAAVAAAQVAVENPIFNVSSPSALKNILKDAVDAAVAPCATEGVISGNAVEGTVITVDIAKVIKDTVEAKSTEVVYSGCAEIENEATGSHGGDQ